jgi:Zn-dependent protease with chaperone function
MHAPSLAARAALAVALMIGFYVLAAVLIVGLLSVPYFEYHYIDRVDLRIGLASIGAAIGILVGIAPRIDKFQPPGVELLPAKQPRLFTVLDALATATGQARPKSVYLIGDLNAWVAQRGGIMGIGSRRVMAIGLPLLETLDVGEMRGVLAHEFGHYHGGDTALGPWIYQTRGAIERTLDQLSGYHKLIQTPFTLYGKTFLKVTLAISRRQEYAADALAARIVGVDTVGSGLTTINRTAPAFLSFWQTEYDPALAEGFRPPVVAGFRAFLAQPVIARRTSQLLSQELESGRAGTYDTHPALRERLAALSALGELPAPPHTGAASDRAPALSLLDDLESLEAALTKTLAPKDRANKLQAIAWSNVGEHVWIPRWRRVARAKMPRLRGLTLGALGNPAFDFEGLAVNMGIRTPNKEERARQLAAALGAPIVIALHANGWTLEAMLGQPIGLRKDGVAIAPFLAIEQLAAGVVEPGAWRTFTELLGLGNTDFSAMASQAKT